MAQIYSSSLVVKHLDAFIFQEKPYLPYYILSPMCQFCH